MNDDYLDKTIDLYPSLRTIAVVYNFIVESNTQYNSVNYNQKLPSRSGFLPSFALLSHSFLMRLASW
jgi:hypothetical protein